MFSVYTTRIEADKSDAPILLSNGNPVEWRCCKSTAICALARSVPEAVLSVRIRRRRFGHVRDEFTTVSGREVKLGHLRRTWQGIRASYAMDALVRSMQWDERVFDREYDLDVFNIVAVL